MEFTEAFPSFGGLTRVTSCGKWIAAVGRKEANIYIAVHCACNGELQRRFVVPIESRPAQTSAALTFNKWSKLDLIWSGNNRLIALVNYLLCKIFVFDIGVDSDSAICTIAENPRLGIERILWSPSSTHLLTVLRHKMGIRLWRLDERWAQGFFPYPKFGEKGIRFTGDGRWMGIIHRKDQQDYISVYDCLMADWRPRIRVRPPENAHLEDIAFVPLYEIAFEAHPPIISWESPLFSNRIFVFASDGESCRVVSSPHEDPVLGCGFERFLWGPMGGWIAAAVKDQASFCIWNSISHKMGRTINVGPAFIEPDETIIFREKMTKEIQSNGSLIEKSKYESSFVLNIPRNDTKKIVFPLILQFSSDSAYVAAVSSEYPSCVWVINLSDLVIVAVLQQFKPVRSIAWHDSSPLLTIITVDSPNVFIWQPTGCLCIPQPAVLDPKTIEWIKDLDMLLITGGSSFCLAVPDWATY